MKTFIWSILFIALAVGYMIWLNTGCEFTGVMTMEGKVCFEDLVVE